MDVTVSPAERRHVDDIRRICVVGWRETYARILSAAEIAATIEEFYAPERIAHEVRSPEGWDGWLVALGEDDAVVGACGAVSRNPASARCSSCRSTSR